MSTDIVIMQKQIQRRIFTIRGVQVMFDSDIAKMYDTTTKRLNEQVKRNLDRFPDDFMFQLTSEEWKSIEPQFEESSLRSHFATLETSRRTHRKYLPFVFTEQGVAGLSSVLKSETAANIHVAIMRALVAMRKFVQDNQLIYSRLDKIEQKQLQIDQKFEQIFRALENKDFIPNQGVFFDGQVFDAYELASKIICSAKSSIVLINNYING